MSQESVLFLSGERFMNSYFIRVQALTPPDYQARKVVAVATQNVH